MTASVPLDVPADLLQSAYMTMDDVRIHLAVFFYQTKRISVGRAAAFAGMAVGQFLTVLAAQHISPCGDVCEALEDAAELAQIRSSAE